jgi:hypothetical protein
MCGEGALAASPRSDHLWRWWSLGDVHREDAACKPTGHADLAAHGDFGTIWALDDDRIAVRADRGVRLFDGGGQAAGELVDFDEPNFQLVIAR